MDVKSTQYEPLTRGSYSSDDLVDDINEHFGKLKGSQRGKFTKALNGFRSCHVVLLSVALLVSNCFWILMFRYNMLATTRPGGEKHFDAVSHNLVPTTIEWDVNHLPHDFADLNATIADPLWQNLRPPNDGIVTLKKSWAAENDLPISADNPEDSDSMLYLVEGLHQLHCLVLLRASLSNSQRKTEQMVPWGHAHHCLDSLRQAVLCNADSTLLYTDDNGITFGNGQVRMCRDWKSLTTWAGGNSPSMAVLSSLQ
ncbi:hypothetical protein BX600DRAFT_495556 [Xylariales sp. PMI_506]|nr:hypothetical protein BX600DRAFT_495556 [Xylariales sp. PMI_506]